MANTGANNSTFSIDRSEFDRLQLQLIELRTTNYQLKEQHSKITSELTQLQQTVQSQSRELEKANKTIQRSKKAKEYSTLVEENDNLQRKLQRQEEDFRLQNTTLMEEIAKICEEKDKLGSEVEQLSKGGAVGVGVSDQVTHLQAENAALLKSMQALKERLSIENHSNADEMDDSRTSPQTSSDRVLELELKLSTEEEEKKLLHDRLAEMQETARLQQAELQSELEKWADKAKKKQDSLVQLQEEKERQFHENRAAFDEMVRVKDHEIQRLQTNLEQTQRDLNAREEVTESHQDIAKELDSLKRSNEELNLRCSILTEDKAVLVKERTELQELLSELGMELQQAKADVGEEKKVSQDLRDQLEEAKMSQEQLADQVVKTSEEKHKLSVELEASNKLAEKRKTLLDEMAIKGQESATEQQRKVGVIEEQFKDEISRLEEQLQQEQSNNWKLTELLEEVPTLHQKNKDEAEKVKSLEEHVKELEETLCMERAEKDNEIVKIINLHSEEKKTLEEGLLSRSVELEQSREKIKELESAVEDKQESVRIVERKSQSLLKDLKRQLQQMKKREEKLQEQLAELRGVEALELQKEISQETSSNHSRESSLSSIRGLNKDYSDYSGGASSLPSPSNQALSTITDETQGLLSRITDLQRDKWLLEERVHHLENTGSALAEDVIQKSEIIKNYLMENKADHHPVRKRHTMVDKLSPMKHMPWTKNKEETLEEINRKMQRALEEALMKNIHLQENVEMLSSALESANKDKTREEKLLEDPTPSSSKTSDK